MRVDEALQKIRPNLEAAFPERFRGFLLYGSEARGGASEDSDLDLMVLLKGAAPSRQGPGDDCPGTLPGAVGARPGDPRSAGHGRGLRGCRVWPLSRGQAGRVLL
jgi:hypothetical protein